MYGWRTRVQSTLASDPVLAFFETPEGIEVLEQIVLAAHLVMTLMGNCGIRLVRKFLNYSGLDRFVASSYGTQQKLSSEVLELVLAFGEEEKTRLAALTKSKSVTLCLDETFPAQGQCLVAMEPVSGFIVLEAFRKKRDVATWNMSMNHATRGLPIEVHQVTSDLAKALVCHAKDQGAHHSPDLFHVQQDIVRALGASLALSVQHAEGETHLAEVALEEQREAQAAYQEGPRRPGRPPNYAQRILAAEKQAEGPRALLIETKDRQTRYREARLGVSDVYHPYRLDTGAARSSDLLKEELREHFEVLDGLCEEVELPKGKRAKLHKARRVTPRMVSTLAFYHEQVKAKLDTEEWLTEKTRKLLEETWIPASYLLMAAGKSRTPKQAELLEALALQLMTDKQNCWQSWPLEEQQRVDGLARTCAECFQRSSSCVEGRNGALALAEHARRQLPERKLQGLTVIHNYAAKRSDGSTAAERFFDQAPRDLFQWLRARFKGVPRPSKIRARQKNETPLLCRQ